MWRTAFFSYLNRVWEWIQVTSNHMANHYTLLAHAYAAEKASPPTHTQVLGIVPQPSAPSQLLCHQLDYHTKEELQCIWRVPSGMWRSFLDLQTLRMSQSHIEPETHLILGEDNVSNPRYCHVGRWHWSDNVELIVLFDLDVWILLLWIDYTCWYQSNVRRIGCYTRVQFQSHMSLMI